MNATLGPVSRALEEDLRAYVVRGGIVVWLDADCTYTGLVERLIALRAAHQLPYEVRAYRGSHLELMMAIDDLADAADKPALVIHAPGFNKESIRLSPLLELSLAGTYYLRALPTVITTAAAGLATPDAIEAFCRKDGLTLERADAWLTSQTEASVIGLRGQLGLHRVPALLDDLFAGGPISDKLTAPDALASFWEHLEAVLGLPAQWRDICPPPGAQTHAEDIAFIAASWALAVEYVDDLRRPPRDPLLVAIPALPRAVPRSTRRTAPSSSAGRPPTTRSSRNTTPCAPGSRACASCGTPGPTRGRGTSAPCVRSRASCRHRRCSSGCCSTASSAHWSTRPR